MDQLTEFKNRAAAPAGNAAQERLYREMIGQQQATKPADNHLTCLGCGARVKSGEELACGH